MQDDIQKFRDNAMECTRLSVKMPEHRTALLEIAAAWMAVADKLEKAKSTGQADDKG
jgi:mannitol-1-phosphate/altronate dehydrogenase